ncbi:hypothetical protein KP509_09G025400 [Ceratopteris richardii]|uniref:Beta-carotene isomerase D27-like C-terminal domain-containing protein n=1 Tax=Ceratopteris richardii TaxID=49495 RepID=A0A8T2U2U0_CERRI|nr:hypothetical protein KP509_09G025400 [Ceratopteris richardii]
MEPITWATMATCVTPLISCGIDLRLPSIKLKGDNRFCFCVSSSSSPSSSPEISSARDPFADKKQYKDSPLDLLFINGCRQAYGRLAGWQSPRSYEEGYLGMVEVSHALMRGKTAAQQAEAVIQGFPKVPHWFRKLFPYSDWGAEFNARITPLFFEWLVGPCKVIEVKIGEKTLKSGVQIEKCRYLETSGCTGMCVNLCKRPTQFFFTKELGYALDMNFVHIVATTWYQRYWDCIEGH